jgi:putative ABC transport system permease protein
MAICATRQQPGRTVLSLIGVVVGSLILVFSLAAQRGIEEAVLRVFSASDEMRRIEVWTSNQPPESEIPPEEVEVVGEMSEEKRTRIRKALVEKWQREHVRNDGGITRERLRELKSMPHVVKVIPDIVEPCWAILGTQEQQSSFMGVPADHDILPERITDGQMFPSDNDTGVLVHEFLAYLWGAVSEDEVERLVGQTVRLEFRYREEAVANTLAFRSGRELELPADEIRALNSALDRIPGLIDVLPLPEDEKAVLRKVLPSGTSSDSQQAPRVVTAEYTIRGVFRSATAEEEQSGFRLSRFNDGAPLIMPIGTATDLYFRLLGDGQYALHRATVIVDDEKHLKQISERLRQQGYGEYSLIRLVEHIQKYVDIITWLFAAVAGIALFVAAIGITNTMIMSVVERTHEIGIMKSVGARDRHVLSTFLVEGALVGVLGAVVAIAVSWGMSFVIDYAIRWILEQEVGRSFDEERVLSFSWWMYATVLAFSSLVTMLAAMFQLAARRGSAPLQHYGMNRQRPQLQPGDSITYR